MFVEGIPIWEQLIYWTIILSVLLAGVIVILGFLIIHVIDPFMGFMDNMKKAWKKGINNEE